MIKIEKGLVPFWDDYMIDRQNTDAVLSVNKPEKKDVVMLFDQPWDGDSNDFFTIVKDDGFYRMYYETWSFFDKSYTEGINVCYAESKDGIHWERPNLNMCEFRGNTNNNIIMTGIYDNIVVMKDENPGCLPQHRYKALMSCGDVTGFVNDDPGKSRKGLICMVSADGIHFENYSVVSQGYDYDSQNSLHWNPHTNKYYCYFRCFNKKPEQPDSVFNETNVRGIMVSESEDFFNWTTPVPLDFGGREDYPLYTNCVMAYPFDTRYYIGFPTRYVERKKWTANYDRLCGVDRRKKRMTTEPNIGEVNQRYGFVLTDCVFMSSRDNYKWYRFDEACITPGIEYEGNWVYGDCYPAIGGIVETSSSFDGEPNELSMYVFNHHWMPEKVQLVRYVYRRDGFASIKADYSGKTLQTPVFQFDASTLKLNFRTSARGCIYLDVLDEKGKVIDGYSTCEIFGDTLDRVIDFEKPLGDLQGKAVCFRFTMRDAEIYAMRFE